MQDLAPYLLRNVPDSFGPPSVVLKDPAKLPAKKFRPQEFRPHVLGKDERCQDALFKGGTP